jgi:hypothetical protein
MYHKNAFRDWGGGKRKIGSLKMISTAHKKKYPYLVDFRKIILYEA